MNIFISNNKQRLMKGTNIQHVQIKEQKRTKFDGIHQN